MMRIADRKAVGQFDITRRTYINIKRMSCIPAIQILGMYNVT